MWITVQKSQKLEGKWGAAPPPKGPPPDRGLRPLALRLHPQGRRDKLAY